MACQENIDAAGLLGYNNAIFNDKTADRRLAGDAKRDGPAF